MLFIGNGIELAVTIRALQLWLIGGFSLVWYAVSAAATATAIAVVIVLLVAVRRLGLRRRLSAVDGGVVIALLMRWSMRLLMVELVVISSVILPVVVISSSGWIVILRSWAFVIAVLVRLVGASGVLSPLRAVQIRAFFVAVRVVGSGGLRWLYSSCSTAVGNAVALVIIIHVRSFVLTAYCVRSCFTAIAVSIAASFVHGVTGIGRTGERSSAS